MIVLAYDCITYNVGLLLCWPMIVIHTMLVYYCVGL